MKRCFLCFCLIFGREFYVQIKKINNISIVCALLQFVCTCKDQKIDWDNWENKRGPRPWEDNQEPDREIKVKPLALLKMRSRRHPSPHNKQ